MRFLIDTNIFVYYASDRSLLSRDVLAMLSDYDSVVYMSAESEKELIVAQAICEHLPLISSDARFPFYRQQGLDLIQNVK